MRVATAPEFEILAKRLGKVYRLARRDVDRFMDELKDGPRAKDRRLRNIGVPNVFKARLPNTSARRGTRGSFRVVYRIKDDTVMLLLIWSKTQVSDIPDDVIRRVANQY